ncbi:hypothetical protein, partial [Salmonella enterica]|uniref:hypothetical protein n=1 Tax=Salmonella enterica TaxID=28901 RepID=UPI0022B65DB3
MVQGTDGTHRFDPLGADVACGYKLRATTQGQCRPRPVARSACCLDDAAAELDNTVAHGRRLGSATDEREKQADTDCQTLTAHIE